jgi:pimeloyl-ACP methyl ester carboxylesterase
MWGWQELIVFPAPTLDPSVLHGIAAQVGAREHVLFASDGVRLLAWHRPALGRRCVLFFHGNAETLADRVPLHDLLVELGWDVVAVAYRGYPGSEAVMPSEEGVRLDARAVWALVTETLGFSPNHVVMHGKSLGGGVASILAEEVRPAGLVLESTFLSIADVARMRFRVNDGLMKIRFETKNRAPFIECPTLVLHADQDPTVPVQNGRELSRLFPDARYVEVPGLGHAESLPVCDLAARQAYLRFIDAVVPP